MSPTTRASFFADAFGGGTRAQRGLLIALYALINGVVLYNAAVHDPRVGYDALGHLRYLHALGATGQLPTRAQSNEFFSPPLPYVPGAVTIALGMPPDAAFKLAQYAQAGCSLALTFFLLKLSRVLSDDPRLRIGALICLGMVPAYYKTFAMVRGEPMLATIAVVLAWVTVRTFVAPREGRPSMIGALLVGVLLGAAILSRQWGFFLVPPVVLIALFAERRVHLANFKSAPLLIALAVFALAGGWCYLHLYRDHGTIRAFNRPPVAASARPIAFYVKPSFATIAFHPVQDHQRARRLIPILYSDTWGDYWMHFLVYGRDASGAFLEGSLLARGAASKRPKEGNLVFMTAYLGRVNVVSIVPSLVLFAGGAAGAAALVRLVRRGSRDPADALRAFAGAVVLCTLGGFLWFVVQYTNTTGDTIKASYILQVFPFLALLAGDLLYRLHRSRPRLAAVIVAGLLLVWVHNAQAMLTRYLAVSPHPVPLSTPSLQPKVPSAQAAP